MRFHKAKIVLGLTLALFATAGTAAPAEEKGGGEAKTDGTQPLDKNQKEFFKKTQRLNSLTTRIEEAERQFQELVRRKSTEKNSEEVQRIIKQMNEVTKDRNKSVDEYNQV